MNELCISYWEDDGIRLYATDVGKGYVVMDGTLYAYDEASLTALPGTLLFCWVGDLLYVRYIP